MTLYMPLATNLWFDNFSMFELNTIMRQADNKPFAELLNRLREGNHTDSDITILREHIVDKQSISYPYEAPHLFATNDKVRAYNFEMINKCQKPVYVIKAKDRVIGSTSAGMKAKILETFHNNKQHTAQLPNTLEIAEGIYYELTVNLNTEDGLINGASCKVKLIEIEKLETEASGVIWVDFDDSNVGRDFRNDHKHLYKNKHNKQWLPIQPVVKQYAAGYKGQAQVQRYLSTQGFSGKNNTSFSRRYFVKGRYRFIIFTQSGSSTLRSIKSPSVN